MENDNYAPSGWDKADVLTIDPNATVSLSGIPVSLDAPNVVRVVEATIGTERVRVERKTVRGKRLMRVTPLNGSIIAFRPIRHWIEVPETDAP